MSGGLCRDNRWRKWVLGLHRTLIFLVSFRNNSISEVRLIVASILKLVIFSFHKTTVSKMDRYLFLCGRSELVSNKKNRWLNRAIVNTNVYELWCSFIVSYGFVWDVDFFFWFQTSLLFNNLYYSSIQDVSRISSSLVTENMWN